MKKNQPCCPRCKGTKLIPLGKKILECEECSYIFKEFDDTEDVMLKITEYTPLGDVSDSVLHECMSMGLPNIGKLKTFGAGKLHMMITSVSANELTLSFHYRDKSLNRTVIIKRGETYKFEENGYSYDAFICGEKT